MKGIRGTGKADLDIVKKSLKSKLLRNERKDRLKFDMSTFRFNWEAKSGVLEEAREVATSTKVLLSS